MLHFNFAHYEGNYNGFTLKKGNYYGYDDITNQKIASSGWTKDNETTLALYRLIDGKWIFEWLDLDSVDCVVDNRPDYQLLFIDWLNNHCNMTFEDWQKMENYNESLEIHNEFTEYYDNVLIRE